MNGVRLSDDMRYRWTKIWADVLATPEAYREFDRQSFQWAAAWLDCADDWIVEDWGAGIGRFRQFLRSATYRPIDGSPTQALVASVHDALPTAVELQTYRSNVHGILIRHVLEHNHNWATILDNALASFARRLCLIICTPFGDATNVIGTTLGDIPDISFKRSDLTDRFTALLVDERQIASVTQYGHETIFCLERTV